MRKETSKRNRSFYLKTTSFACSDLSSRSRHSKEMNRPNRPIGKTSKDDTEEEIRVVRACVLRFEGTSFFVCPADQPRKGNELGWFQKERWLQRRKSLIQSL